MKLLILAHLLPTVHRQAGTRNSKLEEEDDEENDHVLRSRGQRNNNKFHISKHL